MKETLRRRITFMSSLNETSAAQLGNRVGDGVRGGNSAYPYCSPTPFYSRLLERYLKTMWTVFRSFSSISDLFHCTETPQNHCKATNKVQRTNLASPLSQCYRPRAITDILVLLKHFLTTEYYCEH
jgi:hypothetical protein